MSCQGWPKHLSQYLIDVPSIVCEINEFKIVYICLNHNKLLRGWERAVINRIIKDDPTFRGLFIVSTSGQKEWEFVNVRFSVDNAYKLLMRHIKVGVGEKVRTY